MKCKTAFLLGGLPMLMLAAAPARAQDKPEDAAAGGVQDIIVTAQPTGKTGVMHNANEGFLRNTADNRRIGRPALA